MWKILVIDDDFANRQLLIDILGNRARCDAAVSGKEGVAAYNRSIEIKQRYDLILLDIAMPEMDGLQFLKIIRDHEEKTGIRMGHGVPIIMITAFKKSFLEAFNKGCDDYIVKPVDPDALIEKIEAKLGKKDSVVEEEVQSGEIQEEVPSDENDFIERNSKKLKIAAASYRRIITKSFSQNEEHVMAIENAIHKKEYGEMQRAAHSLKGVYGNLLLTDIAQAAEDIDALAREGENIERIKELFGQLQAGLKALKERLS